VLHAGCLVLKRRPRLVGWQHSSIEQALDRHAYANSNRVPTRQTFLDWPSRSSCVSAGRRRSTATTRPRAPKVVDFRDFVIPAEVWAVIAGHELDGYEAMSRRTVDRRLPAAVLHDQTTVNCTSAPRVRLVEARSWRIGSTRNGIRGPRIGGRKPCSISTWFRAKRVRPSPPAHDRRTTNRPRQPALRQLRPPSAA
jgi:hypothetical protein